MKVAINGAGVAGPTLAWWLAKRGHEPVMFERAPQLREGGYIIDFWGYGYDVAEAMGLLPALEPPSYHIERIISRNGQGRLTSHLDGRVFETLTDGRYLSIARSALAAEIWRACEGIETRFSTTIVGTREDPAGVDVTLSTGETERFDAVVGADGLHSAIRRQLFGSDGTAITRTGLSVAAFVLDGYPHRDELTYVTYAEPGKQIARVSLRDDQTMFLCTFQDGLLPNGDPTSEADQKQALRDIYAKSGWEVPEILARLDEVPDVYFDPVAQVRMDRWHKGRVGLIGDAAACPSLLAGEGTSLAMLEAWVLARHLDEAPTPAKAFSRTHETLARTIRAKQDSALRFSGFFAPKNQLGIWLRDKAMTLAGLPAFARMFLGPTVKQDHELSDF